MKIALLAGTNSGCGKTTLMLAFLQYLKKQHYRTTAFKAGPDFLDPIWHQQITGQNSYNLDTQMIGLPLSKQIINQQQSQTDMALIEGVMGLFDGRSGVGEKGSSIDLAKSLNCPVILVINTQGMSGSIVPLVSGYCDYANKIGVTISAIVANQVGSPHHAKLLSSFLNDFNLPPLLAWMNKDAPKLDQRHLGLIPPSKTSTPDFQPFFHLEQDLLLRCFSSWKVPNISPNTSYSLLNNKTIAIAKDAACHFIYPANINWLIQQQATIQYFSPLNGDRVPEQADAIWLPGGYPELYTQTLSTSASWTSLNEFVQADKPILAECGGSVLLGKQLIDINQTAWPMANILPYTTVMQDKLASLGYREDSHGAKGHEFHYSSRNNHSPLPPCFNCSRGDQGVRYKNVRASYIHWYFPSAPEVVSQWFVQE